jgi:hypothetical protein
MVAAIAYDQLTPELKVRVAELLAHSKYPTNGMNDAGPADQGKAAFMMAATAVPAQKSEAVEKARDFLGTTIPLWA